MPSPTSPPPKNGGEIFWVELLQLTRTQLVWDIARCQADSSLPISWCCLLASELVSVSGKILPWVARMATSYSRSTFYQVIKFQGNTELLLPKRTHESSEINFFRRSFVTHLSRNQWCSPRNGTVSFQLVKAGPHIPYPWKYDKDNVRGKIRVLFQEQERMNCGQARDLISKNQKGIKAIYSFKELGKEIESLSLWMKEDEHSPMSVRNKVFFANTWQFPKG